MPAGALGTGAGEEGAADTGAETADAAAGKEAEGAAARGLGEPQAVRHIASAVTAAARRTSIRPP